MLPRLPRAPLALLFAFACACLAWANSPTDRYYQAYYLETSKHDYAAAAKLYEAVLSDASAEATLKAEARTRLAGCREEIAAADLTRLMPQDALAFVEINDPGRQLAGLVQQLGLLREEGANPRDGSIGVSRAVLEGLLGIRGIALAVTGVDPAAQRPNGVAVIHPGNLDVLMALLRDALPIGAAPVEDIEGYPTYSVEGQALVTVTSRLIIVSPQQSEIEGVLLRLKGEETQSLATNPDLAQELAGHDQALLFLAVNVKPMLPLLNAAVAVGASQQHEIAVAQTMFDINSLKSLVGRAGVSDAGVFLKIEMHLTEGHRNLAFNLLRLPPVDQRALRLVPQGAAAFLAMSLNEPRPAPAAAAADSAGPGGGPRPIALLDIGREIFGNVVGLSVFALPGAEVRIDDDTVPGAALVMSVNDPAQSLALWSEFLGIASVAAAGGSIDGTAVEMPGGAARRFDLPEGIALYLASSGECIVISPSKAAVAAALAARADGKSVLDDAAYSACLNQLDKDSSLAAFAHAGRCLELARPMMSDGDRREIEPFAGMLQNAVGSTVFSQGPNSLRLSIMVTGLPNVQPVLTQLLNEQRGRMQRSRPEWTASPRPHDSLP